MLVLFERKTNYKPFNYESSIHRSLPNSSVFSKSSIIFVSLPKINRALLLLSRNQKSWTQQLIEQTQCTELVKQGNCWETSVAEVLLKKHTTESSRKIFRWKSLLSAFYFVSCKKKLTTVIIEIMPKFWRKSFNRRFHWKKRIQNQLMKLKLATCHDSLPCR